MTARPARGSRPSHARRDEVAALLAPAVAAVGLELEDVELRTVGRRLVVRVLVDSERGVTLDEVAAASQSVSDSLDGSDVLGDEPYTLEVSSPGVDRPLTLPRHWRRDTGRIVAVTLRDGTQVTGRVRSADETGAELETNDKGRVARRTVAYADVARALVQVEFSRVETAELGPLDDGGTDPDDDPDPDDPTGDETTEA